MAALPLDSSQDLTEEKRRKTENFFGFSHGMERTTKQSVYNAVIENVCTLYITLQDFLFNQTQLISFWCR